jgi:hypothetical protein
VAVGALVNPHHGRQRAAAEATDRLDSEFEIGRGAARGKVHFAQNPLQHSLASADVAGSAQADLNVVMTAGLQAETVIESGDVKNLWERNSEAPRDRLERLFREIVKLALDVLKDRDQVFRTVPPTPQDRININRLAHGGPPSPKKLNANNAFLAHPLTPDSCP